MQGSPYFDISLTPDNYRDITAALDRRDNRFPPLVDDRIDYGDEWDFLAVKKFGKHYSLLAKYAYYNANKNAPPAQAFDTHNFWLQAGVSY